MEIHIRIDRLVLEEGLVRGEARAQLAAALEAELGRLLAEGGLHSGWLAGGAVPRLLAGPMAWEGGPAELGAGLARTVYEGGLGAGGGAR